MSDSSKSLKPAHERISLRAPEFVTEPMLTNSKKTGGSIGREPLTRREGFLLAAVLIALLGFG